jgi:hypothetical protein
MAYFGHSLIFDAFKEIWSLFRDRPPLRVTTDHDTIIIKISKRFLQARAQHDEAAAAVMDKFEKVGSGDWATAFSLPAAKISEDDIAPLLNAIAALQVVY